MSGTYSGSTIDFLTFSLFVINRSKRYVLPFESTTCQCGSGVCGGTKSSESVSVLLPFAVVWVTKPLLAFAPWNGPLLWLSWAKLLVAAMTSAVKEPSMILQFMPHSSPRASNPYMRAASRDDITRLRFGVRQ